MLDAHARGGGAPVSMSPPRFMALSLDGAVLAIAYDDDLTPGYERPASGLPPVPASAVADEVVDVQIILSGVIPGIV